MLLFRHVIKGFADMSCHASVLGLHFFMRSNVYVNSRSKFVTFNVPILKNLVITFRQLRWYIIKNFLVSRKEYEKLKMSR